MHVNNIWYVSVRSQTPILFLQLYVNYVSYNYVNRNISFIFSLFLHGDTKSSSCYLFSKVRL